MTTITDLKPQTYVTHEIVVESAIEHVGWPAMLAAFIANWNTEVRGHDYIPDQPFPLVDVEWHSHEYDAHRMLIIGGWERLAAFHHYQKPPFPAAEELACQDDIEPFAAFILKGTCRPSRHIFDATITSRTARAVLDLHAPTSTDVWAYCRECATDDGLDWPCSTVLLIHDLHGYQEWAHNAATNLAGRP